MTTTHEFDTGLPSVRQIQQFIRDGQEVELKLMTGDILAGTIRWQDVNCVCLIDAYDQPTLIRHQAIAFVKPRI
ncbi:MAG: RNA-binding protein hfq [Cyanobacteria bacterium P01_A01_bin.135]